jgi:hypothetical protein
MFIKYGPFNDDLGNADYRKMVAIGLAIFFIFLAGVYYLITHSTGY